jgi:hypothetical protein
VTLPLLDSVRTCEKCGAQATDGREFRMRWDKGPLCLSVLKTIGHEHFDRECWRCGYVWVEVRANDAKYDA